LNIRLLLARPDLLHQAVVVRPPSQRNQLPAQVFLQRLPATGSPRGEFIPRLNRNISNRDGLAHACTLAASHSFCIEPGSGPKACRRTIYGRRSANSRAATACGRASHLLNPEPAARSHEPTLCAAAVS